MKRSAVALLVLLLSVSSLPAGESIPTVKLAVAPKYPTLTLAGRVYGEVVVSVSINGSGAVQTATVVSGHPMLRDAALIAARQWQFARNTLATRRATLTFRFVLLPEDSRVKSQTVFLPPAGFEIREKPDPVSIENEQVEPTLTPQPISLT